MLEFDVTVPILLTVTVTLPMQVTGELHLNVTIHRHTHSKFALHVARMRGGLGGFSWPDN